MGYVSNWFSSKSSSVATTGKKTVAKVPKVVSKLETKIAHLTTDLAYTLAEGDALYKEHESKTTTILEKDGWEVLCKSSDFADTKEYGCKAVAFINKTTKQVLIATAGTVPTDIHDLKDDAYIASGTFPAKVGQAIAMVSNIPLLNESRLWI